MRTLSGHRRSLIYLVWASLVLAFILRVRAHGEDAPAAPSKCFMWKVTSDTNTVYLVGSVHVGKRSLYPLPAEVEKAFNDSKTAVFELDMAKLDQNKLRETMLTKGAYKAGDTIEKHIPAELYKKFTDYC